MYTHTHCCYYYYYYLLHLLFNYFVSSNQIFFLMVLGLATYNNPAYRPALLYPPSHHSFDRFEDGLY